jgi:large subunit ribosomal protein L24
MAKATLKTGDMVQVITGKDKGKNGKVVRVVGDKVIVDGINKFKRHKKSRTQDDAGAIVELSMPIHRSNVMLVDEASKKRTRLGKKEVSGKFVRIAKTTGNQI